MGLIFAALLANTKRFKNSLQTLNFLPYITTPVAIGCANGPYLVEIQCLNRRAESAVVRPLALGVQPEIVDGKVCFTLSEPANVTVEFDGRAEGALHLFIDEPDTEKPAEAVLYRKIKGEAARRLSLFLTKDLQTGYCLLRLKHERRRKKA